jgi:hypothetical protein
VAVTTHHLCCGSGSQGHAQTCVPLHMCRPRCVRCCEGSIAWWLVSAFACACLAAMQSSIVGLTCLSCGDSYQKCSWQAFAAQAGAGMQSSSYT